MRRAGLMRVLTNACDDRAVMFQMDIDAYINNMWWFGTMPPDQACDRMGDSETRLCAEADAQMKHETPIAVVYLRHYNAKAPGDVGGLTTALYEKFIAMGIVRDATEAELEAWRRRTYRPPTYRQLARARRDMGIQGKIQNKDLARRHLFLDHKERRA